MVFGVIIAVGIYTCTTTRSRNVKIFHFNLARNGPSSSLERSLRSRRRRSAAFEAPGLNSHGRILGALKHQEHLIYNTLQSSHFAGGFSVSTLAAGILELASTRECTRRRTRADFNTVVIRSTSSLNRKARCCRTEVNATHADPGFLRGKREQQVFGNLARSPVGTAANALLLGTRECRVPIVRVKVLDLFRAFLREGQFLHGAVVVVEELIHAHATVVCGYRIRLAVIGRNLFQTIVTVRNAAVMVGNVPVALEFGNAMVVVVVRVDVLPVDVRVTHEYSLVFIGTHRVLGHAVGNTQVCRTVRQVIVALVLMDVRSFHRLRATNLQVSLGAHIKALHVLVELVDVENVVIVVVRRAAIAATATEREVARTVVIKEDCRVKAPADAVAVRNTATPVVDELLVARNRVRPGAGNAVGADEANAATTAIGEHDVKPVIVGVHCNAGCPDIADTVHLAGIVDNAEVGPVLHVLGAETVEGLDVVAVGIGCRRVIGVRDDVEVRIVGSGTRIRQVMIGGNRVIRISRCGKAKQSQRG